MTKLSLASLTPEAIRRAQKPFPFTNNPTTKLSIDSEPDDGTFQLGVPTGTHQYYCLVHLSEVRSQND